MARRSLQQASCLTRPPFVRSSSSSSARSDDSVLATLKGFSIEHREEKTMDQENSKIFTLGRNTSSTAPSHLERVSTPGRKGSDPIAIQRPGRDPRAVYTPLSARGDLPGGYFPNHEEIQRSYKSHPFHNLPESKVVPIPVSPFAMSPFGTTGSDAATPRGQAMLSPSFPPEILQMPKGKYHPSNYKFHQTSSVSAPTVNTTVPASFPAQNLAIPKSAGKRNTANRPGHDRQGSDVKRKIQQYQREMIAQSRMAGVAADGSLKAAMKEPNSPKLMPCGSPGPITPFELEESSGYMVQRREHLELVDQLMETEDQRTSSPNAMV